MGEETCWLCGRRLGRRVEWHHVRPKSRGGRDVAAVHPICHRTIHACFSNHDLARMADAGVPLAADPRIERFLRWIAGKPPDFHAPTHRRR
ncbi:HNH endonuclease [Consotaella aegiceratis]|uniref:HNH endonuclease n=1 Tax=Consotaella aegiceratis TaxID=3097961 RepID=UPI002F3F1568